MKQLSHTATAIMQEILTGITEVGDSKKIDNNSSFMPLFVECIGSCDQGKIYSLAHYGELNGDAMRDPEMTFLEAKTPEEPKYFPVHYQNDYAGYYREAIYFVDNKPTYSNLQTCIDQCQFAEMWLKNINQQQFATVTSV